MAKQRSRCSEKKGGDQKTAQMVRMMFFPSDVKNPYFTRELPVRLGLVVLTTTHDQNMLHRYSVVSFVCFNY